MTDIYDEIENGENIAKEESQSEYSRKISRTLTQTEEYQKEKSEKVRSQYICKTDDIACKRQNRLTKIPRDNRKTVRSESRSNEECTGETTPSLSPTPKISIESSGLTHS